MATATPSNVGTRTRIFATPRRMVVALRAARATRTSGRASRAVSGLSRLVWTVRFGRGPARFPGTLKSQGSRAGPDRLPGHYTVSPDSTAGVGKNVGIEPFAPSRTQPAIRTARRDTLSSASATQGPKATPVPRKFAPIAGVFRGELVFVRLGAGFAGSLGSPDDPSFLGPRGAGQLVICTPRRSRSFRRTASIWLVTSET